MNHLKKLTLLHSNDLHGDFLAEQSDSRLIGGISRLSGYVQKVRKEEKNVIYAIAGDMLRGSVIDSEYRGLSTIEFMNSLSPDIVTIGNHETDYGLAHLLLLEKCALFPIINANLFLRNSQTHLFQPCRVIRMDGMKILFIGILTEDVLGETKKDPLFGPLVDLEDPITAIENTIHRYNNADIDLTVLLTHIGFEEDKKLAAALDPALGVDLIIGGHSHTLVEEACVVNGIPIVQVGIGTDQIGRFDLTIDTDSNTIHEYTWQCIPIDESSCPVDEALHALISSYKNETDKKYNRIVTRFKRTLTNPARSQETELGNLMADILQQEFDLDLMLFGSGSLRVDKLGPLVTFKSITEAMPFDDPLEMMTVTGAELRRMLLYMLRDETWQGLHTEFYQVSRDLKVTYDRETHSFACFTFRGEPVADDRIFTIGLQGYHYTNFDKCFGFIPAETDPPRKKRHLAASTNAVVMEYMEAHQRLDSRVEGRLEIL